jgi:hypothetical protein
VHVGRERAGGGEHRGVLIAAFDFSERERERERERSERTSEAGSRERTHLGNELAAELRDLVVAHVEARLTLLQLDVEGFRNLRVRRRRGEDA